MPTSASDESGVWTAVSGSSYAEHVVCNGLARCNPAGNINAWSSAVVDTKRNAIVKFGGGHTDSWYNGVDRFDLDIGTWKNLLPYTVEPRSKPCSRADTSGRPTARHTYGGLVYVPTSPDRDTDYVFLYGGSQACLSGKFTQDTWLFDLERNRWEDLGVVAGNPGDRPTYCTFDVETDKIYCAGSPNGWFRLDAFDPDTRTWSSLVPIFTVAYPMEPSSPVVVRAPGTTLDGHFVLLPNKPDGEVIAIDLSRPTFKAMKLLGSVEGLRSKFAGLEWDKKRSKLVAWVGNNPSVSPSSVFEIDPETLAVSEIVGTGGPKLNANMAAVLGHWRYSPASDFFVAIPEAHQDVQVFRFSDASVSSKTMAAPRLPPPAPKAESAVSLPGSRGERRSRLSLEKGTFCIGARPDVVLSDTNDPLAFKKAVLATPDGGVLLVKPGTYVVDAAGVPFIANRPKGLALCGELSPNGKRPHLTGDPRSKPGVFVGWRTMNGDLTIENLEMSGAATQGVYAGTGNYQPHAQRIVLRNVFIHDVGHHCIMVGYETNRSREALKASWNDTVEIYDYSVLHVSYFSARSARISLPLRGVLRSAPR